MLLICCMGMCSEISSFRIGHLIENMQNIICNSQSFDLDMGLSSPQFINSNSTQAYNLEDNKAIICKITI